MKHDSKSTNLYTLDDLYYMVSYIYSEKNAERSKATTFSHFVEVCGMLTQLDLNKNRKKDIVDALCKSLGWYFPLLAKFRVNSLQELIFRKFPKVCPYCRNEIHDELNCKEVKGSGTENHDELLEIYNLLGRHTVNVAESKGSLDINKIELLSDLFS